ncbi:small EDRK-rich factor 2-like [Tachypleus tridentatus]|uniref:small EDRK-rich factor 2-like n=1 Tax=Tachypleus tridentatus TaxID=6853 RepID=UPI003FD3FC2A
MARGNQRELARQKAVKKQQEQNKKKSAELKTGNKGLTLEERKHRDAELMRLKQKKAEEKKQSGGETSE